MASWALARLDVRVPVFRDHVLLIPPTERILRQLKLRFKPLVIAIGGRQTSLQLGGCRDFMYSTRGVDWHAGLSSSTSHPALCGLQNWEVFGARQLHHHHTPRVDVCV